MSFTRISTIAFVAVLLTGGGLFQVAVNEAFAQTMSSRGAGRATQPPSTRFDEVLVVQRLLNATGFAVGPINGKFTPQTREAIRSFQRQNFMRVDGRITLSLVTFLAAHVLDNLPDGDTKKILEANTASSSLINVQDRANVALVQRILTRHGFGPGRIDGRLGSYTTRAILNFQTQMDLPETGEISSNLLDALGQYDARR